MELPTEPLPLNALPRHSLLPHLLSSPPPPVYPLLLSPPHSSHLLCLSRSAEPPSRISLPGGLFISPDRLQITTPLPAPTPLPPLIPLRLSTLLAIAPAQLSPFTLINPSDVLTIASRPFPPSTPLSSVTPDSNPQSPHAVVIYTRPTSSTPLSGLAITNSPSPPLVPLDVIAYCPPDATRSTVVELLCSAANRALSVAHQVAPLDLNVRMSHYPVLADGLVITVVSPADEELDPDETGTDSVKWRGEVHDAMLWARDRPLLRRACRVYEAATGGTQMIDGGWKGRLRDVHVGLKAPQVGQGVVTVSLVQGGYLYCHYRQDGGNDSGWGCAYRSLQTIVSWCVWQGYATMKGGVLPGIVDIQKALVAVGDKEESLVGSKEWIGANEVCYALEKLTGVESRILHVSSGGQMEERGRELVRHFEEVGSPVMVGGGVLAWTILGVARNERTGKCKFLILDPHYEGTDDLALVQGKGWVAWKGPEVFKESAFYNLCLPQRPQGV